MIVDTIVIDIPEIKETSVFAMLSAIQAYERNAFEKHAAFFRTHIGKGNLQLNIVIVRREEDARFDFIWKQCLEHLREIHPTLLDARQAVLAQQYDLTSVVVLDENVARALAHTSKKHLAQTFGIMLGSEATSLPNVDKLVPKQYETHLDWILIAPPVVPNKVLLPSAMESAYYVNVGTLEERVVKCFECVTYAGQMSFESYLMCALKKPVFEISSKEEASLLSKWSSQNYIHSASSDDASIERGVTLCLNRLAQGK